MNINALPSVPTLPITLGADAPKEADKADKADGVADAPKSEAPPPAAAEPPRLDVMSVTPQGAAAALAELPDLDGNAGVQIQAQISEHMFTLTELVQTIKKAMGEMRELVAQEAIDAAQAQKKLVEAQARVLRFINNPPTPEERRMLQAAQQHLHRDLAHLEVMSAWMLGANGGVPLSPDQKASLDRMLLRIADDLVKIADLTQGSVQVNNRRDFFRTDENVRQAKSGEAVNARLNSAGYEADLNAWVSGQRGAGARDAQDRLGALRREGGMLDGNDAALARANLASTGDIQQLVATLMDDLLPGPALEEVRQGLAMLQAFNSADLAMMDALKQQHFGGRMADVSHWQIANFETHVSRALREGGTLGFQSHDAQGHYSGWTEVKLDANALRTSVLLGDLSHARENLKKELQELADVQGALLEMEKSLGELVRMIAIESMLMLSQWDDQTLGDLARIGVQYNA